MNHEKLDYMKPEEMELISLVKHFTIKDIIISKDLLLALIISFVISYLLFYFGKLSFLIDIISNISPIFIGISGTMITIAIAGLAIIVALADENFIKELKKAEIYRDILFLFLYSTLISSLSIVLSLLAKISTIIDINSLEVFLIVFFISLFFTLYSIFIVVLIIHTTMKFGFYRGNYIAKKGNKN